MRAGLFGATIVSLALFGLSQTPASAQADGKVAATADSEFSRPLG